jgi:hypothetical protein
MQRRFGTRGSRELQPVRDLQTACRGAAPERNGACRARGSPLPKGDYGRSWGGREVGGGQGGETPGMGRASLVEYLGDLQTYRRAATASVFAKPVTM